MKTKVFLYNSEVNYNVDRIGLKGVMGLAVRSIPFRSTDDDDIKYPNFIKGSHNIIHDV